MTVTRYLLWIGLTILWFAALSAAQYPIRKRCGIPIRVILISAKLWSAIVLAYALIAVDSTLVYRLCFVLAPLYVALFADAVGGYPYPAVRDPKEEGEAGS